MKLMHEIWMPNMHFENCNFRCNLKFVICEGLGCAPCTSAWNSEPSSKNLDALQKWGGFLKYIEKCIACIWMHISIFVLKDLSVERS